MTGDVEEAIAALMKRFRVSTDQGLADRLRVGRSTVTSWRRRGAVPERYMRLTTERPTALPDILDPSLDAVERDAWVLALVRLVLGPGARIVDYPTFLRDGPFLPRQLAVGLEKALLDLSARMEESGLEDPRQALNLIVFEDFFSSK
jgi:Bacteriophage CI repressor helix-turn-helix domain